MPYPCPKGHTSTDSDYCSECGALIGKASVQKVAMTVGAAATDAADICPDCATLRTGGSRFCEVCRYDFQKNMSGVAESLVTGPLPEVAEQTTTAQALQPVDPIVSATEPDVVLMPLAVPVKLNVAIIVDPSLATDEATRAACPQNAPERIFPLDLEENLVGRRSDSKGIFPEVEVKDPGVSHRHLQFLKHADGSFIVLELGSANGTELNGAELQPGVATPVKAGDELLIGMWSRLQLRTRGC